MSDRPDLAARIAAVPRATPLTPEQQTAAIALLADMLTAAAKHGVALADFDWVADLPGACVDVTRRRD